MKKLGLTVVVLGVMLALFILFTQAQQNDVEGEIRIQVVNQLDEIVIDDTVLFEEEDTLFSIMQERYEVGCANAQYQLTDACEPLLFDSRVILKINEVETNWNGHFIGIYVDVTYSNHGIDSIALTDGTTYRFEFTLVGGDST